MRVPAVILALSSLIIASWACAPTPEQQEPAVEETVAEPGLEGAWETTEVSFVSPDTSYTINDPQPSLYVFLERHYSIMYVPGDEPRELFAGDQPVLGAVEPTDAEKVTAFNSFIANSGTYEATDSTLSTRPVVSKTPNFMASGSLTFTYQVVDDNLHLTIRPPWEPDSEISFTLTRLE